MTHLLLLRQPAVARLLDTISQCSCQKTDVSSHFVFRNDGGLWPLMRCNLAQCINALADESSPGQKLFELTACTCGSVFPECKDHIEALDKLANLQTTEKQYRSALHLAFTMMRTSLDSPWGYLRAVRILKEMGKVYQGPSDGLTVAAEFEPIRALLPGSPYWEDGSRLLMRQIIRAGTFNVFNQGPRPKRTNMHNILWGLALKIDAQETRRDPLTMLPPELTVAIFSKLSTGQQSTCLLVSKHWNRVLLENTSLWNEVNFSRPGCPRDLVSYLNKRSHVRRLSIQDVAHFGLSTQRMIQLVRWLPQLTSLHLGLKSGLARPLEMLQNGQVFLAPRLRSLKLCGIYSTSAWRVFDDLLGKILPTVNSTLVELILSDFPTSGTFLLGMVMRKLEILFLDSGYGTRMDLMDRGPGPILMKYFIWEFPNIRQLYLNGFELDYLEVDDMDPNLWPDLEVLILGPFMSVVDASRTGESFRRCMPMLSKKMRIIDLLMREREDDNNASSLAESVLGLNEDKDSTPIWPKLEKLRIRAHVGSIENLSRIVAPSLQSGTLKVLDLGLGLQRVPDWAAQPGHHNYYDGWTTQPAVDLGFTCSPNLHTLGLSEFIWADSGAQDPKPFLDWLDQCPNVHTVRVYPGSTNGNGHLFKALVKRGRGLRTIYLHTAIRNNDSSFWGLEELAEKHGVTLCWTQHDFVTPDFPDYG